MIFALLARLTTKEVLEHAVLAAIGTIAAEVASDLYDALTGADEDED